MNYAKLPSDDTALQLLEAVQEPTNLDKINLGALIMRYAGFSEMQSRAVDVAMAWGYSPEELMVECREIWLNGFRPQVNEQQGGSGHDTATA